MEHTQSGYSSAVSRSNWNSGMLVLEDGEKPSKQGLEPTTNSTHWWGRSDFIVAIEIYKVFNIIVSDIREICFFERKCNRIF